MCSPKRAAQAFGNAVQQGVGRIQADFLQQLLVVVGLQQQQAVLGLALGRGSHRVLQRDQEGLAVEQAGDLVALAQLLDFAREFRVGFLAAEDHLQAGLALVHRRGEFHDRGKRIAAAVVRLEFVARRRRLALAQALEQGLETIDVLGCHQVQQRHALEVVERFELEHLHVGRIGTDVHAFMDVGDGVARGLDQGVAAALGFAHLGLELAQRAPRLEIAPFGPDHAQHLLRLVAQGDAAHAGCQGLGEAGIVDPVDHGDHGQVLAAGLDQLQCLQKGDGGRALRGQDQVDRLVGKHFGEAFGRIRAQRSHGDARVAQGADD